MQGKLFGEAPMDPWGDKGGRGKEVVTKGGILNWGGYP
jgi:hypothetical protein